MNKFHRGLPNDDGKICFINSIIQGLLSSKTFVNKVLNTENTSNDVINLFKILITKMVKDIDIKSENYLIRKHLEMKYEGQNCTHEALILLLDKMNMLDISKAIYKTRIVCNKCLNIVKTLSSDTVVHFIMYDTPKLRCDNFRDSIKAIVTEGSYDGVCNACDNDEFIFADVLTHTSDLLIITLNQFMGKKVYNYLKYLTIPGCGAYRLISTVNHRGNNNYGHYWTTVYTNSGTIIINDDTIHKCVDGEINHNGDAFVLFYERVSI